MEVDVDEWKWYRKRIRLKQRHIPDKRRQLLGRHSPLVTNPSPPHPSDCTEIQNEDTRTHTHPHANHHAPPHANQAPPIVRQILISPVHPTTTTITT